MARDELNPVDEAEIDRIAIEESIGWGKRSRESDAAFEARLAADPWWNDGGREPTEVT